MTLTPCDLALAAIAAPLPESRLTSSSTFAPFVIACSACCCWADLSPSAFWISDSTPALSNAAFRNGRSTVSQRTDDLESGSRTATLPAFAPSDDELALPPLSLSSSPQPAATSASAAAPAAIVSGSARRRVPRMTLICVPLLASWSDRWTGPDAAGAATSDCRAASSSAPRTSARSPSTPRVMRTSAAAEGMA